MNKQNEETIDEKEIMHEKVKQANKEFYDIVSTSYEHIDGKRDATTEQWITKKLRKISEDIDPSATSNAKKGEKLLLDIGCGSGFIMRNAQPYFNKIVGVDISHKILVPLQKQGYLVVCADTDHLPFKKESFSMISCFAVLHHLYAYNCFFREAHSVLKKNGIFYSDHDLDHAFSKRFSPLFKLYRFFFNEEKKYKRKEKRISSELYHFTEIHNTGISTEKIIKIIQDTGFTFIQTSYHWFGLFPIVTRILRKYQITFSRANAPLVSVVARK